MKLRQDQKECEDTNEHIQEQRNALMNREYAVSRKLLYEANAHRDLERSLEDLAGALQSDQYTIAGLELELEELQKSSSYVMDLIKSDANPTKPTPLLDRLRAH